MTDSDTHAVTGAFGYTGRFITHRLLENGKRVIALTNSVDRANPFAKRVTAVPFNFKQPSLLAESLRDVKVLYNTYWIRFNHTFFTIAEAIENTLVLFEAAKSTGVQRIVHVSITNPREDSSLEYFAGKAKLEMALKQSGISYAILRPAVLFGAEDILVNNIAWAIRRLPVMGVFGDGKYKLQPIHVEDLADLAVQEGASSEKTVIDAIGPETFTFRELVETIGRAIGVRRPIIQVGPSVGHWIAQLLGRIVGDVILTREEIEGLMAGLLCTDSPPVGRRSLTDWIRLNADRLGRSYSSELIRRTNRLQSYKDLSR